MICEVCRVGLKSIWDPRNPRRIGPIKDFPDLLYRQYPKAEGDDVDQVLENYYKLCEPERYVFGHHADYDSLARSKEQSCVVCKEFSYLNDCDDVNPEFEARGYYSVFTVELSAAASPRSMLVYTGEILEQFTHDLILHDSDDHLNPAITSSTSDDETWTLVQEWLGSCAQTHYSCSNQTVEGFTPTRLLELDTSGPEKLFRLVNGCETRPAEPYVTLSHCWGSGPAEEKLRLLTTSECILRDGLPVSDLPRLFRDAFAIVERLSVRYIWIDRLCIIQNSDDDWAAEAATMHTVYQNGLLNIAALGANDDRDGCFFERDPLLVAPTVVNLSPPGESSSLSQLYRFAGEDEAWRATFEGEPLLSRAWVLQERVLTARNLYFGRRQVFWECCEATRCETVPRRDLVPPSIPKAPRSADGEPVRRAWKRLIDSADTTPSGRSRYLGEWPSTVRRYCQCSLTFSRDKLVALSGLAKDMGARLRGGADENERDSYLAGLWRDTMPQSLLWKPKLQGRRPSSYRAPSWSWASIDGDIEFPRAGLAHTSWHATVVAAQTTPRGGDVTGELVGGSAVLSTPLCVVRGIKAVKTYHGERKTHSIKSFHHPDTGADMEFECRTAYIQFDTDDFYDEVAVLLFRSDLNKQYSALEICGLAVIQVDKTGSFHRLG
ncbi:hypothetical protein DL765_006279 [Monosporascus sp. GIB2]|nr:hypothetical protein DL765_006279 [Monosporascus sp. GIB2]